MCLGTKLHAKLPTPQILARHWTGSIRNICNHLCEKFDARDSPAAAVQQLGSEFARTDTS